MLLTAGRREAALSALGEAIELYERKGNLVSAAGASALGQSVVPPPAVAHLDIGPPRPTVIIMIAWKNPMLR